MKAPQDPLARPGDGWALALVGTVVALVTAICVILFEISKGWWGVDGDRGIVGWAVTVATFAAILFVEFWLLLAVFRRTGLKLNKRRLEPKAPLAWQRYVALFVTAGIVALTGIVLFHQAVPILPFRSEIMLAAVGVSGGMLEFVDLKANRGYWLEKQKQANAEGETNPLPPRDPPPD